MRGMLAFEVPLPMDVGWSSRNSRSEAGCLAHGGDSLNSGHTTRVEIVRARGKRCSSADSPAGRQRRNVTRS